MHFKVISVFLSALPSQYVHQVLLSLTLGPAAGDKGELVARPLSIQPPLVDVEALMTQADGLPPEQEQGFTSRRLSPFLYTGRPALHCPTSNLLERLSEFAEYLEVVKRILDISYRVR